MSDYAWVIDRDHLAEDGAEPGHIDTNAATVTGPRDAPLDLLAELHRGGGRPFRMFDDDGERYYDGRIVTTTPPGWEVDFGPLDDFGKPNAGATEIRYRVGDVWATL